MQAFRTRAAGVARRARATAPRTSRSYASESHGHHHEAPQVSEGLGTAFYVFASALPLSVVGYQISRPGADGEPSSISQWLQQFDYFKDNETRNSIRTELFEQAAHDKHLLLNAGKSTHVELKMPELFNSGSPWNVPAGHSANLDHITEHYRKQAAVEEERKAKKLAALAAAAAEAEASAEEN
ncbi:hypothetical protein F4808DRAFT_415608 [Astrocystis sublimbata]|nr:hypothetical protein F4808DRAFT_415608 [Astrocystis sublimbata]